MNTMHSRDVMTGLASPIDFPEEAWPDSMGDFIQWGKLWADLRRVLSYLLAWSGELWSKVKVSVGLTPR
jgi:hypothetical protein